MKRIPVRHKLTIEGFSYDVIKGELVKGTKISKAVHPVKEVELIKGNLLKKNYLKNDFGNYILKRNYKTGLLMALNLHNGKTVEENYIQQDIVFSPYESEKYKDDFFDGNLRSSESDLMRNDEKHRYRFVGVYRVIVDKSFLQEHSGNEFGKDETFVLNILKEKHIIGKNCRHGKSEENEADIVDEDSNNQYEVIFENKYSRDTRSSRKNADTIFSPEWLLVQLVDNQYIHISEALKRKFSLNKYTEKYKLNIVILNVGTMATAKTMMSRLADYLNKEIFDVYDIFVMSYDFLDERIHFWQIKPSVSELFNIEDGQCSFVQKTKIDFADMMDDEKYLLVSEDIFKGNKCTFYGTKVEIEKFIDDIGMFF